MCTTSDSYWDCENIAQSMRLGIGGDGTGLEKLMYDYGVDLYLAGHVHNYERMFKG